MADVVVSLPFGAGTDTKSDPKMSGPAKLNLLQDCIFTNIKRLTKRNGYDLMTNALVGGGTYSSPTMAKDYRNELVLAATTSNGKRLLSYSSDLNAWSDRGKYASVSVTKKNIAFPLPNGSVASGGASNVTCVASGGLQFYAYFLNSLSFSANVGISVIDSATGMHLETASNSIIPGSATDPRAVLIGASTFGVLYGDGSGQLSLRIVSVTSGGVSVGAPIVIASSYTRYDVQSTATGAAIGFGTSAAGGSVHVVTIDTSGSVVHFNAIATAGNPLPVSITVDSLGNLWVYWADVTTPSNEPLYYAVFSSIVGLVLGKTTIASGLNQVTQISSIATSSTQQNVYYSTYDSTQLIPRINLNTADTSGTVGSPAVYLNNVDIYSKIVTLNSVNYMAVMFMSDQLPTGFLIDLTDGKPVAKFIPIRADGLNTIGVTPEFGLTRNLVVIASNQLLMGTSETINLFSKTNTSTTGLVQTAYSASVGAVGITFDFNHIDSYQAIVQQDTLVLNGGFLYEYDGSAVCELGFSVAPEITGTTSGAGGVLPTGSWLYYVTYEWSDANGNLYQSAPSVAYRAVFGAGATNKVVLSIKTLTMTQKLGVNVVIWRTINAGVIAYRLDSVANDPTTTTLTYTDSTVTDATIQLNETLYTEGGAVLENIAPPPSMIMWTNNNRIWCVDSENPETTIEYSKTASEGSGVSFSTGALELVVDSKFGAITGAKPLDEKTVLLKEKGIMYFIGDGANDAGSGSTISTVQTVPSDTGCSNSKSVIVFPHGILFRASDNKGIYIFSRGVQVQYFGLDVEAYNQQDVRAAELIGDRNQIRFLTSSGNSLLYDYVMNQWSVFTNHSGYSSAIFNGVYVYVRTDGSVYQENESGSYLDNATAISPLITFSWIKAQNIQGFQRCRRIALLGDFKGANGGHGVGITIGYDFQPSFSALVPYYFSGADGPYQYRERLSRQKCDSFQITIQEITTGASGEYIDFNDLGLEIMSKTGLNKLPGTQSVG